MHRQLLSKYMVVTYRQINFTHPSKTADPGTMARGSLAFMKSKTNKQHLTTMNLLLTYL